MSQMCSVVSYRSLWSCLSLTGRQRCTLD